MDAQMVREQLEEIRGSLQRNEAEHEVLLTLFKGFEGWLRIHGLKNGGGYEALQPEMKLSLQPSTTRGTIKGTISFRAAILQVLKEARGAPLHAKEILLRAQRLGAVTTGKNPVGLVSLAAIALADKGVEKVAPRTWWWREPTEEATDRSAETM